MPQARASIDLTRLEKSMRPESLMIDVLMPQMGESIVEGTVTKWLKRVGETIERDEPLLEISTDKVDSEVPAPSSGVLLEVLVEEGKTVDVNTVLARIENNAEVPEAPNSPQVIASEALPKNIESSSKIEKPDQSSLHSSPLVRRLAKENKIDLRLVAGTGMGGRISKKDVEEYLKVRDQKALSTEQTTTKNEVSTIFTSAPTTRFGNHHAEPISTMRKRIAEHMVVTKRVAPHVSTIHQVDVTAIAKLRERCRDSFAQRNGVKLTYMPFFLHAAATALKAYPLVNASLDGEEIIFHSDVNIGIAVALDPGLIVPVIPQVNEKSISALQKAVADLAFRARSKQLTAEEIHQGTFSISNYGAYGSLLATPAINQPQSAILGLGEIHKKPVVLNDAIAIRSVCYVTLTFDHRLLDGAVADSFLNLLGSTVENWTEDIL